MLVEKEIDQGLKDLIFRIYDVEDQVAALGDEMNYNIVEVQACHEAIDDVVATYKELLAAVPEKEQFGVERKYGRKVMDMRRKADFLPELQVVAPVTDETQGVGSINSPAPRQMAEKVEQRRPGEHRVGDDLDAWCGPCDGLMRHSVVAMVGEQVKQVVCSMCGARHGFRLTAARAKTGKANTGLPQAGHIAARVSKPSRAEEARMALQKELSEATDVREFAPRARYKAGEIIEHPQHGRGKIENVLRGSILVRFRSGLRPLNTF